MYLALMPRSSHILMTFDVGSTRAQISLPSSAFAFTKVASVLEPVVKRMLFPS